MSHPILVTVIVPVYQAAPWLAHCLDSLVVQSLKGLEVLMINDGSTDQSAEIARSYCDTYPERFRLIDLKTNYGISRVRNLGLSLARGDFVGFVDADDYAAPAMFEKLYRLAYEGQCDWVSCKMHAFEQSVESAYEFHLGAHYDDTYITNKLFRRSFVRELKLTFYEDLIYEDEAFVYVVRLASQRTHTLPDKLYYYRMNPTGACRDPERTRANLYDKKLMLARLLADLKQRGLLELGREMMMQCLANHALSSLYYHNTSTDKQGFFRYLQSLAGQYRLGDDLTRESDYKISRFYRFSQYQSLFYLVLLWLPVKGLIARLTFAKPQVCS